MIYTACSEKADYKKACYEIHKQLETFSQGLLLFFASAHYPANLISPEIKKYFPKAVVVGCTSAGEICNHTILNYAITAMAIEPDVIGDFTVGLVNDLRDMEELKSVCNDLEGYFNTPLHEMNPSDYIGMILVDGLSESEEVLTDHLGTLTPLTFVGGTASDNHTYDRTHLFYQGAASDIGGLILLAKPHVPFRYLKTQSFDVLPDTLTCTKAEYDKRMVYEINHKPAALAYAEILGVKLEKLPEYFTHYPLGLMIDGDPYVRTPRAVVEEGIAFSSGVLPNTPYHILKANSIIADTKVSLGEAAMALGEITGIIDFDCNHRTESLKSNRQLERYGEIFRHMPTVGFSTYGEIFKNHINQTASMILFGKKE